MPKELKIYCRTCQDTGFVKDSTGTVIPCPKCSGDTVEK